MCRKPNYSMTIHKQLVADELTDYTFLYGRAVDARITTLCIRALRKHFRWQSIIEQSGRALYDGSIRGKRRTIAWPPDVQFYRGNETSRIKATIPEVSRWLLPFTGGTEFNAELLYMHIRVQFLKKSKLLSKRFESRFLEL